MTEEIRILTNAPLTVYSGSHSRFVFTEFVLIEFIDLFIIIF